MFSICLCSPLHLCHCTFYMHGFKTQSCTNRLDFCPKIARLHLCLPVKLLLFPTSSYLSIPRFNYSLKMIHPLVKPLFWSFIGSKFLFLFFLSCLRQPFGEIPVDKCTKPNQLTETIFFPRNAKVSAPVPPGGIRPRLWVWPGRRMQPSLISYFCNGRHKLNFWIQQCTAKVVFVSVFNLCLASATWSNNQILIKEFAFLQ